MDTQGNIALQGTIAGGLTTGTPGASLMLYGMDTDAPTITKLEGAAAQIGGSAGIPIGGFPLAVGLEGNIIPDEEKDTTYLGLTKLLGIGTPGGEAHVEWGETSTWEASRFNIYDTVDSLYKTIMGW